MKQILRFATPMAFLLVATSSFAAGPFFVGFEANFVKPTGMPQAFALSDPNTDSDPEGALVNSEFSNELAPQIYFGWMTGSDAWVYFDFWQFDETESTSVANVTGGELWDILYHAEDARGTFEGTASADLTIDAQKIDFGYGRKVVEGDRFTLGWMGGLRYATLDYMHNVVYDDVIAPEQGFVSLRSETDGIGVTGGLKGKIELNDRVSLSGGVQYSLLSGSTEYSNFTIDTNDLPGDPDTDIRSDVDGTFSILEADAMLVFSVTDKFRLHFGLEYGQWNEVVAMTTFPDDVHPGFTLNQTSDVDFDGYSFGATIAWGGDK